MTLQFSVIPKKTHTKTKTGCMTCRKRRIKCDEAKPDCNNCSRKKLSCHYATVFKTTCYIGKTPNANNPKVKLITTEPQWEDISTQNKSISNSFIHSDKIIQSRQKHDEDISMLALTEQVAKTHNLFEEQLSHFELADDGFSELDIDMFYQIFKDCTSQILTIKTKIDRNPWMSLVWPLALKQSVLFEALVSMIFFHIGGDHNQELKKIGNICFKRSIAHLGEFLSNSQFMKNSNIVILITCLVLARAEVWSNSTSSGIAHLRGAQSSLLNIVKQYDDSGTTQLDQEELELFVFGYRTFLYMSSMARTGGFSLTDLVAIEREELYTDSIFDNDIIKHMESKSHLFNPIDPILGCFPTLMIIIGKVFTFINRLIAKNPKCHYSMISPALELRKELESWEPNLDFLNINMNSENDPLCDLESCVKMANCYRFSALLYLHEAVPDIPSKNCNFFVKSIINLLKAIPLNSKLHLISISPMFYAACESNDKEDREWFNKRWKFLSDIMRVNNLKKVEEIVRECWRRRDSLNLYAPYINNNNTHSIIAEITGIPEGNIRSVSHWTSVMDDFEWEVMRC